MKAKPTLGYKTRSAAVVALRQQGLSSAAIADKIGITTATVTALEHSAGRRKKSPSGRAPRPSEELGRTVLFAVDVLNSLGPHAAKRGMHPNTLARAIVETVVDEGLVDAILDDAP